MCLSLQTSLVALRCEPGLVVSSHKLKVNSKIRVVEDLPCHSRPLCIPVVEIAKSEHVLPFANSNAFQGWKCCSQLCQTFAVPFLIASYPADVRRYDDTVDCHLTWDLHELEKEQYIVRGNGQYECGANLKVSATGHPERESVVDSDVSDIRFIVATHMGCIEGVAVDLVAQLRWQAKQWGGSLVALSAAIVSF